MIKKLIVALIATILIITVGITGKAYAGEGAPNNGATWFADYRTVPNAQYNDESDVPFSNSLASYGNGDDSVRARWQIVFAAGLRSATLRNMRMHDWCPENGWGGRLSVTTYNAEGSGFKVYYSGTGKCSNNNNAFWAFDDLTVNPPGDSPIQRIEFRMSEWKNSTSGVLMTRDQNFEIVRTAYAPDTRQR